MRLGRAMWLVCGLASGCDRLFALTHVPDPPADAYVPDAAPPCLATDIAIGQRHGCAIDTAGDVYCWGGNLNGQVLPGGDVYVPTPTNVPLPSAAAEIEVGKEDTCARIGGDVYCWGANEMGQLGKGSADTSHAVRKIDGIPASAEVSIGGGHICSRSVDGTIWCWGRNLTFQTGQLASSTCTSNAPCTTPAAVPNTTGAKRVATGHNSTCMIDANDQLFCWGRNRDGQLGIGTGDTPTPTLVPITPPVRDIDIAGKAMCAIDGMQRLWCTGEGEYGQIGNGGFQSTGTPAQVFVSKPTQLAVNGFGACTITEDHALSCWGTVDAGDGMPGTYGFPHVSSVRDLTKLVGHFYSYCGIADGGVLCWGENTDGQLGRGMRGIVLVPQSLGVATPSAVALGEGHGCAITSGVVKCWGSNAYGEAGDHVSLVQELAPVPVTLPTAPPQFLAAFQHRTCAWGGGEGACWGRGFGGSLGSLPGGRALAPTKINSKVRDGARSVGLGANHLCVIDDTGGVTCFGRNDNGQLGDGSTTERQTGTGIVLTPVDQVVAGTAHTCARKTAGEIWCWGANNAGQIGDAQAEPYQASPKNVNGVGIVVKIGAGEDHVCSLDEAGEVWCWGRNNDGQIGNGSRQFVVSPFRTITSGATDLVVGARSACAKVGGTWQCWGRNDKGQLADGSDTSLLVPTTITAFSNATTIATGNEAACMMTATDVACAGALGTLGTGDNSASFPKAPMLPGCQ